MTNQILDVKNYDLKALSNSEKLEINGGLWWLAVIEFAWELKYNNSIKEGYDAASNFLLNDNHKN
jgi:hypothetical protein